MGTTKLAIGLILVFGWLASSQQFLSAQPIQMNFNDGGIVYRSRSLQPVAAIYQRSPRSQPPSSAVGSTSALVSFSDDSDGKPLAAVDQVDDSFSDPVSATSVRKFLTDDSPRVSYLIQPNQKPTPASSPRPETKSQTDFQAWTEISEEQPEAIDQPSQVSNAYHTTTNQLLTTENSEPTAIAVLASQERIVTTTFSDSQPIDSIHQEIEIPNTSDFEQSLHAGIQQNDSRPFVESLAMSSAPVAVHFFDHRQPTATATKRLGINDISGVRFVHPKQFLKEHAFNFVSPNQFLVKDPSWDRNDRATQSTPPVRLAVSKMSNKMHHPRREEIAATNESVQSKSVQSKSVQSKSVQSKLGQRTDDELRRLTVADVHAPISFNPFGELEQLDRRGILQEKPVINFVRLRANSYAEFSGQYFQPHYASWEAHHFYHKPLYFEETNLERYGNQVHFQNLASTAHFFSSAALLPYKLGQIPPNSCLTTLGHRRPGECVPYQIHRRKPSPRGAALQALPIIAISL